MDFRLPADGQDLAQAVREFLIETHGPDVLRRLDTEGPDDALWQKFVDLGLTGVLVPTDHGGLGLSLLDGALIARECGRACVSGAVVDTALVAVPWLLGQGETGDLAAIARGERCIPLPHSANPWVSDGDGEELAGVDPLRRLTTVGPGASSDPRLLDLGALMSAAQLIGLAETMLGQAVSYAQTREQFGQPIGAFQAIKHMLADVAVMLEFLRPVVWRAAQAMQDALESAPVHVSHAKYRAIDVGYRAAETAIQVHGAMGYTYEVDLHFWMKRTWALAGAWGDRSFHFERVERAVCGGTLATGPRHTFD